MFWVWECDFEPEIWFWKSHLCCFQENGGTCHRHSSITPSCSFMSLVYGQHPRGISCTPLRHVDGHPVSITQPQDFWMFGQLSASQECCLSRTWRICYKMGMQYMVVGIICTQHNLVGMWVFCPTVARWELPRRLEGAGGDVPLGRQWVSPHRPVTFLSAHTVCQARSCCRAGLVLPATWALFLMAARRISIIFYYGKKHQ